MELQALASRVEQLQAADLSAALQALLKQAQTQLKPPSRSAAAAAPTAPATRQALVSGVLLLLERAAVLAARQQDLSLIKDATSQLVVAFQQHRWLWELLLHKHLPDLLQHPAASQLFAKALSRLPGAAQARALHVWRQKLAAQPELAERVPPALVQLWLEQLGESFQARRITLPVMPGAPGPAAEAAGGAGTAAVGSGVAVDVTAGAGAEAEVHVVLREQLPHLLQLLLLLTCSVSAGGAGAAAATTAGASSGEREDAPCLSSMQSTATELRPVRGARQQQQQQGQATDSAAADSSASAGAGGGVGAAGLSAAIGSSHMRDGVLRHAVLLVSQLSNPDALHSMLGIQPRQQDQAAGSDSDGEQEQQGNGRQQRAVASGAATGAAQEQALHLLSQREADRVRTAQALIEVCLDGVLTLQPLAAAVHDQLHMKGNSSGGGGTTACEAQHGSTVAATNATAGSSADDAALGERDEQAATALAELRHTVGLMLGLHRELTRLLHNQQQPGAAGSPGVGRQWLRGHLLSLAACPRLLDMLTTAHPAAGAATGPGGHKAAGGGRRRSEVGCESSAEQGPLALLLVPPQLVPHGLELVRQAVEAASSKRSTQGSDSSSWCAELAGRVAAIYASCYQAMWGAQVLQSAEAYQLLLPASRMRTLLRMAAGSGRAAAAGAGDGEAEAAAEAALLAQNAVGIRQRRLRGTAHELPVLGKATPGASSPTAVGGAPPAKRRKPDPNAAAGAGGGSSTSAVAELLQLFQPPASQDVRDQQQQPQGEPPQHLVQRKRIQALPVRQEQHAGAEQQQQQQPQQGRERKRIVPQQLQPEPAATQMQKVQEPPQQPARAEDAGAQPEQDGGGAAGYQRVIISKTDGMTDEEQGALWEAYIADKEFLLEMLGDSEYQQWYDEAAHPLRKQHHRPGGLEAAWAAVLGGPSGRSLVQLQLPRSLLEASGAMPWDAAAAACLHLLHALLGAVQRSASGSAGDAGGQAAQRELLQRVFGPQQREAGALAATRICQLSSFGQVQAAMKSARDAPAGGSSVLLAAQLLSLLKGEQYFGRQYGNRSERELLQRALMSGQHNSSGGRIVAPPLLAAYAQLLAALLPAAHAEELAAGTSGRAPRQQHLRVLLALLAQRLLLLPPPVQHLLGGDSTGPLLRLALPTGDEESPAEQAAALLWMLVQQQLSGGGRADEVQLPGDAPLWLEPGAAGLLPSGERSKGHAMLLGPLPEARRAAAAELLSQLQRQVERGLLLPEQQRDSGTPGALLSAESMLPAADACYAAIQLVLAEHERQQGQPAGGGMAATGAMDGEQEDEEGAPLSPLLLDSAAAVAGLAAALCQAGAAAAAELASQLDAAAGQQQPKQQRGAADWTSASEAAAAQALCRQLLEAAVLLADVGCLPPAAAQQLQAAIEALNGQLEAIQQLAVQLPGGHALVAAMLQAWEAAPTLWRGAAEPHGSGSEAGSDDERPGRSSKSGQQHGEGGGKAGWSSSAGKRGGGGGQGRGRRRKRLRDVRNPAVRAMLAEDGGAGDLDASDLSDLEDFLVFNPERDYEAFFRQHFYHVREGDSEEEEAAALPAAAAERDGAEQQARQAHRQADRQADKEGRKRSSSKKAKRKAQGQE